MSATEWTIESADGTTTTTRFVEAVRAYNAGGRRLLRDGRPLPMTNDPTLFEETT